MFSSARVLLVCSFMILFTGCSADQGVRMFSQEFFDAMETQAEMLASQGVIDKFATDANGRYQNPGVKSSIIIEVGAQVALVGANGEIDISSEGTGNQLPTGFTEAQIEQHNALMTAFIAASSNPNTPPEAVESLVDQINAIREILGWNRVESPHNPTP